MPVPLQDLAREYAEVRADVERALLETAASGRYVMGPAVEALEQDLAGRLGVRHVVSVASGTDAIFLMLAGVGVSDGDEVITSPFTFFSTAASVSRLRGKPIFVDLDPETLTVDPQRVREAITPRTRALLPVHIYGQPSDLPALQALADEHGLALIEDAAQAIGASHGDRMCGGWGKGACFSFYPTKNLGAMGDAGAISTNDDDVAAAVRRLRSHGSEDAVEYREIGINSRMDALQAAVLSVKLSRLDDWTAARRRTAARYDEAFTGLPVTRPTHREEAPTVYHQYTLRTPERDALRAHLREKGVGTGVYYPVALHLQPCFEDLGHVPGAFPVAEAAAREVLSLPIFPGLLSEEIDAVVEGVRSFFD